MRTYYVPELYVIIAGVSVSYKDSGYPRGPPRWDRGHLAGWEALTLPPLLLCLPPCKASLKREFNTKHSLESTGPSSSGLTGTGWLLFYRWGTGGSEGEVTCLGHKEVLGLGRTEIQPRVSGFRAHDFFPALAASQSDRIPVPIKSSSKPELCRNQTGRAWRAWVPRY